MRKKGSKKGFTLIEMALAVGFIAMLSLTVTLIINDTVATYRRGITLNLINTVGMDLVDDFRSAIQNSPARQPKTVDCQSIYYYVPSNTVPIEEDNACMKDEAMSLISLTRYGYVDTDDDSQTPKAEIPIYGAVCTGSFTYIWNSGYYFGENSGGAIANMTGTKDRSPTDISGGKIPMATFRYGDSNNDVMKDFRLLKVRDSRRAVCKTMVKKEATSHNGVDSVTGLVQHYQDGKYYKDNLRNDFTVRNDYGDPKFVDYYGSAIVPEKDIEVVLDDTSANTLALYDLSITAPSTVSSGEAAFYSASFILGTVTGGIDVRAKGNFCKTPEDYEEDFDYCSINKFNFAAQATGG